VFWGQAEQKLDSRFRVALGKAGDVSNRTDFILGLHPLKPCLWLIPKDNFQQAFRPLIELAGTPQSLLTLLDPQVDQLKRRLFSRLAEARTDDQLRISLDPELAAAAGISAGGRVVLVGCASHIEIWAPERFAAAGAAEMTPEEMKAALLSLLPPPQGGSAPPPEGGAR